MNIAQARRLGEDEVHMGRHVAVGRHAFAPAGQEDDRGGRRAGFDGVRDFAAIDVGHAEIGDDEIEGVGGGVRDVEGGDGKLAGGGGDGLVAVALQGVAQGLNNQGVVVGDEQAEAGGEGRGGVDDEIGGRGGVGNGEKESEGGAAPEGAIDLDRRAVTAGDA